MGNICSCCRIPSASESSTSSSLEPGTVEWDSRMESNNSAPLPRLPPSGPPLKETPSSQKSPKGGNPLVPLNKDSISVPFSWSGDCREFSLAEKAAEARICEMAQPKLYLRNRKKSTVALELERANAKQIRPMSEVDGDEGDPPGGGGPADPGIGPEVDGCSSSSNNGGPEKNVIVGICAMAKKSSSRPMQAILSRLEEFEYIKPIVFPEETILKAPIEEWPIVDCLISFHSKGFPLDKTLAYSALRNPLIINNIEMQFQLQDRRSVYSKLEEEGILLPRYAILDRETGDSGRVAELIESEDGIEVNGTVFNKPFVEKPISAEDHNIYIYYPTSAGGGSQRLFRKIGSRSSVYSPESRVRKSGSFIYEDFMPTDGTDVKVYTVGPDYAHAEARKSPALDGKVERDSCGKEVRYPVILSAHEKLIARKVCLAFKQTVCGFDLLRANGKSYVCDVNGFSFVKNSNKYYDDCARILGNMILRELAPTLHIPWAIPFQLDDPPIVPTTFGKMMELRCVVAVIRHGDRTPKQKMKMEVRHPRFFHLFQKFGGSPETNVKLKKPKELQEVLDIARALLTELQQQQQVQQQIHAADGATGAEGLSPPTPTASTEDKEIEEKRGKLDQLKSVLEMYGYFAGINRKVQLKYQPKGRPRASSSEEDAEPKEPSLVLILKWGGELTPAGRVQAEELGRIFRCMYPGGQGQHTIDTHKGLLHYESLSEYAGPQGLGLLRLHSTFRHDLKIYASDEGRVQMTAAAFAKGLLALEGELTPILVQMVKSAHTNGLLDNDCESSKFQKHIKQKLHELMQQDKELTEEDFEKINPTKSISISNALRFIRNPVKCCERLLGVMDRLMECIKSRGESGKASSASSLYHGESWDLMGRRWGKLQKDFVCPRGKYFDISKVPDIYDCIKYDIQHNLHAIGFPEAEELYVYAKNLADVVIPQEYGINQLDKLAIAQGICSPLLKKIRSDLQRNFSPEGWNGEEPNGDGSLMGDESVNRLNPSYSHGVSSPGRHVRTRLYFTSESHIHSLLTMIRYGGLVPNLSDATPAPPPTPEQDEQWARAMEYVSAVSELNYLTQIVIMLYEDPTKEPDSEERFHVELHFSPGVNCGIQKNFPQGPGFRPNSRSDSHKDKSVSAESKLPESSGTTQETLEQVAKKLGESDGSGEGSTLVVVPSGSGALESTSGALKQPTQAPTTTPELRVVNPNATDVGNETESQNQSQVDGSAPPVQPIPVVAGDSFPGLKKLKQALKSGKSDEQPFASGKLPGSPNVCLSKYKGMKGVFKGRFGSKSFGIGGGGGSSSTSLFSTAVITGQSTPVHSSPLANKALGPLGLGPGIGNLSYEFDGQIPMNEGFPPIRPLETLHNALSWIQLDGFLERILSAHYRPGASLTPSNPIGISGLIQGPSGRVGTGLSGEGGTPSKPSPVPKDEFPYYLFAFPQQKGEQEE